MNRLLKANFKRLFKSKFFIILISFSAFLSLTDVISLSTYDNFDHVDNNPFELILVFIFLTVAFVSSFIGSEYSDGTIRNKIMIGHSRIKIFAANFTVCTFASFLINFIHFIVEYTGNSIILKESIPLSELLPVLICFFTAIAAITAITVCISMAVQNKSSGSIISILLLSFMFINGLIISEALYGVEYDENSINNNYIETEKIEESSENELSDDLNFLKYEKRMKFIDKCLPVNQLINIGSKRYDNIEIMIVYSLIITAFSNAVGIIIFKIRDIK